MKKSINKIILALLTVFTVVSCGSDPDNAIYKVLAEKEYGAILRTLALTSPTFDINNLSSYFEVEIEEQDEKYGDLLSNVEVFVSFQGNEALVNSIAASEFVVSANNLPSTVVNIVLQDALDVLGLPADDVNCGDLIKVRLQVNLTDGRSFTNTDASGSLLGSYFSSPYIYDATIVANLENTLYTGEYMLETVSNGLYGVADFADGVYTIEATAGATRTVTGVTSLPAFGGFGPIDITINFVCGELILSANMGAGCDDGIFSGEAEVNSTYDADNPDDSSFVVTFTSDATNDCGQKTQASIRLTKI